MIADNHLLYFNYRMIKKIPLVKSLFLSNPSPYSHEKSSSIFQ